MDRWYETLVEAAAGLGLDRNLVDQFEEQYDRRLAPLQALIVRMHDAGLCSENGDFGPQWQGISERDKEAMGWDDGDCEDDEA